MTSAMTVHIRRLISSCLPSSVVESELEMEGKHSKRDAVRRVASSMVDGGLEPDIADVASEAGVSQKTARKWLSYGWETEWDARSAARLAFELLRPDL